MVALLSSPTPRHCRAPRIETPPTTIAGRHGIQDRNGRAVGSGDHAQDTHVDASARTARRSCGIADPHRSHRPYVPASARSSAVSTRETAARASATNCAAASRSSWMVSSPEMIVSYSDVTRASCSRVMARSAVRDSIWARSPADDPLGSDDWFIAPFPGSVGHTRFRGVLIDRRTIKLGPPRYLLVLATPPTCLAPASPPQLRHRHRTTSVEIAHRLTDDGSAKRSSRAASTIRATSPMVSSWDAVS